MDTQTLGMFPDMPNETYHADPAIGSSGLKLVAQSPLHYWAAYLDPQRERREPTPAMKIGTAWHAAVFEPAKFAAEYIEIPEGLDRRTKEGKALWEEIAASGREPMTAADMRRITRMAENARTHPVARVIFNQPGGIGEQSIFTTDPVTGLRLKIRPDYAVPPCSMFPHGLLVDGKTGEDMSAAGFAKYAMNWELYLQAAYYSDVFQHAYGTEQPPVFMWLAQEKDAPYATACYSAAEDFVAYGRKQYRRLLDTVAECYRTNRWPGYPGIVQPLELPVWAAKMIQEGGAA